MPAGPERPHLRLPPPEAPTAFRANCGGGSPLTPPQRDREAHAEAIRKQLEEALGSQSSPTASYLAVRLATEDPKALASLASSGAELAAVLPAPGGGPVTATVIVPAGKADRWLSAKLAAYKAENTKKGRPKHETLIANIGSLAAAGPEDIFTGPGEFPAETGPIWWQVWLDKSGEQRARDAAQALEVAVTEKALAFPDEVVVLARTSRDALARWMRQTGAVLELRRPEIPAILGLAPHDQAGLVADLAAKLLIKLGATAICLLDAGVTRGHALVAPAADPADVQAYEPTWPVDDLSAPGPARGHGTAMAGLALYGDLQPLLTVPTIPLAHRLESVRILPPREQNDPRLYGVITKESAARPEVAHPKRRRVYCMAVTAEEVADGLPTAWSAAVDDLCFNDGEATKLFVVSAGNRAITENYPDGNDLDPIQDPAQAWNALTVGAFTDRIQIGADRGFAGWRPVASAGGLAPTSRTSVRWTGRPAAPLKPDVVMEGGNATTDGSAADFPDDLQLLTTAAAYPGQAPLRSFGDTSAAAALASRLAAQVWRKYPGYRAETVRALLAHSASWTLVMAAAAGTTQASREQVLRRFGYGVPDAATALSSFSDRVTLVAEHSLTPFTADGKTGGMVLHRLPWPAVRLLNLAGLQIEFRVTLSYFVQPKPGRRGGRGKYQYPSHQLRFEVKRSDETRPRFLRRINRLAEDSGGSQGPGGEQWTHGSRRDRGSLHSDIWCGDAADLAKRDLLAVFPASGWWKAADPETRTRDARYSLIITLRALEAIAADVDLYAEVKTVIENAATTPIEV